MRRCSGTCKHWNGAPAPRAPCVRASQSVPLPAVSSPRSGGSCATRYLVCAQSCAKRAQSWRCVFAFAHAPSSRHRHAIFAPSLRHRCAQANHAAAAAAATRVGGAREELQEGLDAASTYTKELETVCSCVTLVGALPLLIRLRLQALETASETAGDAQREVERLRRELIRAEQHAQQQQVRMPVRAPPCTHAPTPVLTARAAGAAGGGGGSYGARVCAGATGRGGGAQRRAAAGGERAADAGERRGGGCWRAAVVPPLPSPRCPLSLAGLRVIRSA